MNEAPLPPGIKVLSESEIQQKLYGGYLGERKHSPPVKHPAVPRPPVPTPAIDDSDPPALETAPQVPAQEPEWTGSEILAGELKRLRDELIVLRNEREDLERRLVLPVESHYAGKGRAGKLWGIFSTFLCIAAVFSGASPFGVQKLHASPMASPYTVQVGAYDVRPPAEHTMVYLQEMGYPAFLVDSSRRDGKRRYKLYVGQYRTKAEASLQREKLLADKKFNDAFIRYQ